MKTPLLFVIPVFFLVGCTPATVQAFGEGLSQGLSGAGAAPQPLSLECSGQSAGTFTQANARLSLTIKGDGEASGTFTNNGTVFAASGLVKLLPTQSSVNLLLDSRVEGGATALVGVKNVGASTKLGSTGSVSATLTGRSVLTGTFKGVQGNYRLNMTCVVQ